MSESDGPAGADHGFGTGGTMSLRTAFRLLDPASFDWGAAGASPQDWTPAEAAAWSEGLRFAAGVARRFAGVVAAHAGPFTAFAVTLERRADMGPDRPEPLVGAGPDVSERAQEPP